MAHILFIGAGPFQMPVIEEARARGCRISVIDGSAQAPGIALAGNSAVIDIRNVEACLALGHALQPDAVLAVATEAGLPAAAAIADALRLPGVSLDAARKATNKQVMRDAFETAGLASARYRLCRRLDEAGEAYRELGPRVVVKPVNGAGSRGVSLVTGLDTMVDAFEAAKAAAASGEVLVETFMEGPEIAVEGVMAAGRFIPLLVSDKTRSTPPALLDLTITYPSLRPALQIEAIHALAEAGAHALGIDNAPVHVEMIMTADGPHLVEIAARGAGFHVFNTIVPAVTGIDTPALQLDLALGIPIALPEMESRAAILDFPLAEPGEVVAVSGLEDVRALDGVLFAECFVRPGDTVRPLKSGSDRAAAIAVAADTPDEAREVLARARDMLRIETRGRAARSAEAWSESA